MYFHFALSISLFENVNCDAPLCASLKYESGFQQTSGMFVKEKERN